MHLPVKVCLSRNAELHFRRHLDPRLFGQGWAALEKVVEPILPVDTQELAANECEARNYLRVSAILRRVRCCCNALLEEACCAGQNDAAETVRDIICRRRPWQAGIAIAPELLVIDDSKVEHRLLRRGFSETLAQLASGTQKRGRWTSAMGSLLSG